MTTPASITPPEWLTTDGLTPYPEALAAMQTRVAEIRAGTAPELVWLLQHPPLYTAGTSASPADLG
ncbi:MAG TPA: lipoate-protein ligase B, partial [Acetobacteraceae bacterium]|nr:lipoate-protein ligase B [Acetobacteraceae bacterium]